MDQQVRSRVRTRAICLLVLTIAGGFRGEASAQTPAPTAAAPEDGARHVPPTLWSANAVPAHEAPVIDGRGDDPVWRTAPVIDAFTEWQPSEGSVPRFRTEARVAYDAANLYVFVRAFDPHPDSIIRILERRDTSTPSDMIWVIIDSYDDHRTGFKFGVNAAGVKLDQAMYNDGGDDAAWDGVWDVATQVDSLGWTAEYRIPMSQLRYGPGRNHVFGFGIDRDIYRYNERVSWPALSAARPGLASQLGTLTGLDGLETPRRVQATPYVVSKYASRIVHNKFANRPGLAAGGDISYRLASNLTMDATVNPDFGQVESDPAVLNLTAYESFFDERRPFFVAGRGLFEFDVDCNEVNCSGEGLYYSRRIGRTPQLAGTYGDTVPLAPTTIAGAAKVSGHFGSGLTLGVLDAVTERAGGGLDTTYEPATNYAVVRATQDLNRGNTTLGGMVTAVNRAVDRWSAPYLSSDAYVGAVDFRHRFLNNRYEVSGSLDESQVRGSHAAILALQRDAVHDYQRPDGAQAIDSTRAALTGDAEELKVDKVGGEHMLFETAYQRRSPGFEANDLGYLRRADQRTWSTWIGLVDRRKHLFYQSLSWNNNWWQSWSDHDLALQAAFNTNLHITFKNNWSWHAGVTVGQVGATYDDRAARGGPAIRQGASIAPWVLIEGNDRRALVPSVGVNYFDGEGGRNHQLSLAPEVDYKLTGRFSSAFAASWAHNVQDDQWYGNFADSLGATHYTFAHLDQTTRSATVRLNYTFTTNLSLQTYLQGFASSGSYANVRELSATPRAASYRARFAPYDNPSVTRDPGGFEFRELQSNVVVRWEYQPGSTLFLVWNEGRQGALPFAGDTPLTTDVRDLFRLHPENTFLVKLSYWLNR